MIPTERQRWRCGGCGNLTRFDVTRTRRTTEFWHFDLAGDHRVETVEVDDETVESVRCRWCGRTDAVELVDRQTGDTSPDPPWVPLSVPGGSLLLMTTRIDCDTCVVRGPGCHDCVVTVLLGPLDEVTFDDDETRALEVLAAGGLVPPLRMVKPVPGPVVESA